MGNGRLESGQQTALETSTTQLLPHPAQYRPWPAEPLLNTQVRARQEHLKMLKTIKTHDINPVSLCCQCGAVRCQSPSHQVPASCPDSNCRRAAAASHKNKSGSKQSRPLWMSSMASRNTHANPAMHYRQVL